MKISEILGQIPTELTDQLAKDTGVNHSIQRLRGQVMLDLLLFGMVRSERLSTRVLERFYNSALFTYSSCKDKDHRTRHSSIADRLKTMNPSYFKAIFEWAFKRYFNDFGGTKWMKKLIRFDSTMIKISSALVEWGMRVGRKPKNKPEKVQLKVTLGMKGMFPKNVKLFVNQKDLSEENALKNAILANSANKDEIVSFDMGLKSRKTLQKFDNKDIKFVTKGKENLRYKVLESKDNLPDNQDGLRFLQDSVVYLYTAKNKTFQHRFRLIEVQDIETSEKLFFITNISDLEATTIAQIYQHRWDIEVFFRFIKQELNIKHLLSHSLNGIKIQIYVTLLLAILLTVFTKSNNLKGYKIPKIMFEQQLMIYIVNELILANELIKSHGDGTHKQSLN